MTAPGEPVERRDVEALLATRRDLGPEYDDALLESFVERVERAVVVRTQDNSAPVRLSKQQVALARQHAKNQVTLGIVSVGCGIPITAISAAITHLPGLGVAWVGIVGINVAHALAGRRRRP